MTFFVRLCNVAFVQARRKIKRANEHISHLDARVRSLEQAYTSVVEVDPYTGNEFIKYELEGSAAIIEDIAVIFGDAVHNLRCALDYAWVKTLDDLTIELPDRYAKLPIHPTSSSLEAALKGAKIDVSSETLFDFILNDIQPYDGGNFAIWPVHQLDKRDKHRLLTPVFHYSFPSGIKLENDRGDRDVIAAGTSASFPFRVPIRSGYHVTDKGDFAISVMFAYGKVGREGRVVDTLRAYSQDILMVADLFEGFVES
jgi:hypothetical protein